jgi:hypothetical protein
MPPEQEFLVPIEEPASDFNALRTVFDQIEGEILEILRPYGIFLEIQGSM